ncbi:MAG: GGDEF domain-containing protein [Kofleriaceae bacterium]|jgi:diguanylate cyclase (GGDEF)-like protein|nr:GGDEF domain-containing protein [Kofleriaceae bacterium]MBP6835887.1 GGDEF domain-containing protein [Kofleriaceae bacterium]MBP9203886.1 GGDEF domain-containing protein [Kofleriaceae bacterium]
MKPEQLERLPATLFEIGKLIGSELDPGVLLSRIAELICQLVGAHACSVMLLDASRQRLLAKAAYGLRTERMHTLSFAVGEGVAGWVVAQGEAVLIDDVAADPRFVQLPDARTPIAAMMCVPLLARTEAVGVVTATSHNAGAFAPADLELLRFLAMTIALDVENVRLRRVAVTDVLTGAYNREFLGQRLPLEIDTALTHDHPLCVAMVDVDHFKPVNDRFGHDVGDDVLAEVARRLRSAIRGGDLLVRYGGEEFLVVLPRADAGRAWEVGERMRLRVGGEAISAGPHELPIRVSIGVAQLRIDPVESAAELIKRADSALYAAKGRGRDRVEVAP